MNVTSPSADPRRAGGVGRLRHEARQQHREARDRRDGEPGGATLSVVSPADASDACRPPLARAPSRTPSTAWNDPTPTPGCGSTTPRSCSRILRPNEPGTDPRALHLTSLASSLRTEMVARLPGTDCSASWVRHRFSYYTYHPAGSDYGQLFGKSVPNRHLWRGFPLTKGPMATKTAVRPGAARRRRAGRRQRVPRPRAHARQPRRGPARLLGGHRGRRGLHAAVPGPAHRRGPRRGRAPQLLRRGVERRLGVVPLHRPRRGVPPVRGVASPHRHPGLGGRPRARRAGRALRAHAPDEPQRRRHPHPQREPRHRRDLVRRRPPAGPGPAVGRRPPPRRGLPRRARAVAAADGPDGCCWSPTTTRWSSGCGGAGAVRRRPGRLRMDGGPAGGPGRAAGAGGRVRGRRRTQRAHGGRAPAAHRRPRRPGRPRSRDLQPVPRRRGPHRAQHVVRRRLGHRPGPRPRRAPGLVGRRPGHRHVARPAPAGGPGPRPRPLRLRDAVTSPRPTALPSARP